LDEDYYLTNFRSLIDFVAGTYKGLLNDAELDWYRRFGAASEPAQRLYVRLLGRRPIVFRVGKLRYNEIESIQDACQELAELALASCDAPTQLQDLLAAFTKPELLRLLSLENERSFSRPAIDEYLLERENGSDLSTLQSTDKWISIQGIEEFTVFKLCFFGNCYQDLSEFVLRDLGVFNYEQYTIDKHTRVFQSREQIDAHLQYFACSAAAELADFEDAKVLLALSDSLPQNPDADPHLNRRIDRMRNSLARQLERLDASDQALLMYQQSERPPSRERQVRLLMKLGRPRLAEQVCNDITASPRAEEELQFIDTITPKLNKLLKKPAPVKNRFKPLTSKLTLSQQDARVESIAKDFYTQFGQCFYVENSLVNGVLGLFIWDIIFSPEKGVFYNPFQSAPADFYLPEFLTTREAQLEQRFDQLNDPLQFAATVWEHFESKQGRMNPLVHWGMLSEELLSLALIRIPAEHWRVLFQRILQDVRNHTSGLPDLILFPKAGEYEFIEIKGPGDAVQKNQHRWMKFFSEHRIPYRVVQIRWANQSLPA